ncbi:kinase-like protein [Penicillium nucicola]|uniref:kinase-like protein n=1 Tax=Penicillium nucicola TaxID=1850975 RepID=UPI002545A689|nr:kinase-like protein [Penicillium nucicola]KAJ5754047.1 kinase-like protein [Penicillium nucicola]
MKASSVGQQVDDEFNIYRRTEQSSTIHPDCDFIRTLLDIFYINGPHDKHRCLVHLPLWESGLAFFGRNSVKRLPSRIIVVHWIIFIQSARSHTLDDSFFTDFAEFELQHPVLGKATDTGGRTIHMSRRRGPSPLRFRFGHVWQSVPHRICSAQVLSSTGPGFRSYMDIKRRYMKCEVHGKISSLIMIWDIYESGSFFTGQDPEFKTYWSRAHLAEMINLRSPPPSSFLTQEELRERIFPDEGKQMTLDGFLTPDLLTDRVLLEERKIILEGTMERESPLRFMRKILQWESSKRSSAKELSEDE